MPERKHTGSNPESKGATEPRRAGVRVGESHALANPSRGGQSPALIWITDPADGVLRQALYDPQR